MAPPFSKRLTLPPFMPPLCQSLEQRQRPHCQLWSSSGKSTLRLLNGKLYRQSGSYGYAITQIQLLTFYSILLPLISLGKSDEALIMLSTNFSKSKMGIESSSSMIAGPVFMMGCWRFPERMNLFRYLEPQILNPRIKQPAETPIPHS